MKHKFLKHLLSGVGVCSLLLSVPVKAAVTERASTIANSQVEVTAIVADSAVQAATARFPLTQLEVSAASAEVSTPAQEAAGAAFGVYVQPDDAVSSKAPDPAVFLLVLIGLIGLLIGRRRFR